MTFSNDKIKRKFCSIFVENNCFFAAEVSEQEVAGWILVTGQQNVSGCIHKKSFSFSQVINSVLVALSVVETFFRDKIEKNLFMSTTVVEKTTTCLQANFL